MKFVLGIKPTILTGRGTTYNALWRVRDSIRGGYIYSTKFGYAYTDSSIAEPKIVYGYNIEVFKRGKHRHNKHYVIYCYAFPIEMFNILNVEINQGKRTFTIKPKKK